MAQNYCLSTGGNTGRNVSCDPFISSISGLIFTPSGARITEQEAELLLDFLAGKAKAPTDRWFPLLGTHNVTDNTTEPTEGTLATTDYSRQLKGAKSIYLLEWDTTICLAKVMARYNNYRGGLFVLTEDRNIFGLENPDGSLSAITPFAPLSVYGAVFGDGQNLGTQKLVLNLGSQLNLIKTLGFFSFSDEDIIDNIRGLTDVRVRHAGGSDFQVLTTCGGDNLYDSYKAELEAPSLWKVQQQDGTAVAVTNVVADAATKAFTLTPGLAAGTYRVGLAGVAELEAAGIVYYENPRPTLVTVSP